MIIARTINGKDCYIKSNEVVAVAYADQHDGSVIYFRHGARVEVIDVPRIIHHLLWLDCDEEEKSPRARGWTYRFSTKDYVIINGTVNRLE